jgi:two-component system response regulator
MNELLTQSQSILLIEDNEVDNEATCRAFRKASLSNPIVWRQSGEDALDFLKHEVAHKDGSDSARSGLILLDLNMSGMDGRYTLEEIEKHEVSERTPIIVLTTSADERDVEACCQTGANTYVPKDAGGNDAVKSHGGKMLCRSWNGF